MSSQCRAVASIGSPGKALIENEKVNCDGADTGWLAAVAMLYSLCKWMAGVKASSKAWWLSYL